jgi:hypothetical protein
LFVMKPTNLAYLTGDGRPCALGLLTADGRSGHLPVGRTGGYDA